MNERVPGFDEPNDSAESRKSGRPEKSRLTTADHRTRKLQVEVAHLVGPGSLRVRNGMPHWRPVTGPELSLHPERLRTVLVHGVADLTGKALRLLWRHGVQVSFVGRRFPELTGRIAPPSSAPALACWQHWAVRDPNFVLEQARWIVGQKLSSVAKAAAAKARRGNPSLAAVRSKACAACERLASHHSLAALRGVEGAVAAAWYSALRPLIPGKKFVRAYHPPPDPVNAMLSLGYMLMLARVEATASGVGLDPVVGVLHQIRAGRPALACDLMEPLRADVDLMVVGMVRQKRFGEADFSGDCNKGVRLRRSSYRRFLHAFEERYHAQRQDGSSGEQVVALVETFARAVRGWRRNQQSEDK